MTAPAMQLSPNLITGEMGVVIQRLSCKLRQSIQRLKPIISTAFINYIGKTVS